MDQDKIREIIYSKCKVYRKEEQNPFEDKTIEAFAWYVEKTMMRFNIPNLEDRVKNFHTLTDRKLASIVRRRILKRYTISHHEVRELYGKIQSLPFISE